MERFAEDAELVGGLRTAAVGPRRVDVHGRAGQGGGGREVLRLLQRLRAGEADPVAPRAGAAARPQGRHSASERRPAGRRRPRPVRPSRSGASPRASASTTGSARPTRGSPRPSAGPGSSSCSCISSSTPSSGCAKPRKRKRSACSARNLRDLLLAAPAGQRVTMGLDPGIRTGVKVAVVDGTGKLLETATDLPARAAQRLGGLAARRWPRCARSTACS